MEAAASISTNIQQRCLTTQCNHVRNVDQDEGEVQ